MTGKGLPKGGMLVFALCQRGIIRMIVIPFKVILERTFVGGVIHIPCGLGVGSLSFSPPHVHSRFQQLRIILTSTHREES